MTGTVQVVGAGGIGLVVGRAIAAGGRDVRFVETNPEKLERFRLYGLADHQPWWGRVEFEPFHGWQPEPDAPVLLCVKCYDNADVLAKLPPDAPLIPIQNGFDPELDARPHHYEGIASFVARCRQNTLDVSVTRLGELHVGPRAGRGGDPAGVAWLAEAVERERLFTAVAVPAIEPIKHTKLMYNAAISPLAAAAGLDNGALLSVPAARRLFFALLRENYAVLTAAGCELGTVGPFKPATVARILQRRWLARLMAGFFEPSLRGTYCSMAGEIETGRTELDNYTGHLVRLAEKAGEPAPLNRAVYDVVKRMERERAEPRLEVIDEIAKSAGERR